MCARLLNLPGMPSCEEGRARGAASGRGGKAVEEKDALPCHAVERRGVHRFVSRGRGVAVGLIVGDRDKDVGPGSGGSGPERCRGTQQNDNQQGEFYHQILAVFEPQPKGAELRAAPFSGPRMASHPCGRGKPAGRPR